MPAPKNPIKYMENNKQKNYGLIIPKIKTREEGAEHILGSEGVVINPTGDYRSYLPDKEPQNKNRVETMACSVYGTLSALETLLKFKGYSVNYSDRYLAIVGNVDPYKGADPHKIAECIRNVAGCLKEDRLPFSDDVKTVDYYYGVPKDIISQLIKEGQRWYDEWEFSHKWVFQSGKPNEKRIMLQQALPKGTVCVSVSAWFKNEKGVYYKPEGTRDNHWTLLSAAPPEKYFVFDSYDNYEKELEGLYDFSIAKVYFLNPAQPKLSIIEKILQKIAELIPLLSFLVKKKLETPATPVVPTIKEKPEISPVLPQETPEWDTPQKARHSVRVICDEMDLAVWEKNLICQILNCESQFNVKAVHKNSNGTTDYGICQYNDKWYIGTRKPIASVDEALNNPEKCVKVMINEYKHGRLKNWVCYSSKKYLNYKA